MEKKKILVIDDEYDLTYFIKSNLELAGNYEVITAASAKEGIKIASQEKPDMIFLDLMMPDIDGYQAMRIIQKDHPEIKKIPITIITGSNDPQFRSTAEKFGIVNFLVKPLEVNRMITAIESCQNN